MLAKRVYLPILFGLMLAFLSACSGARNAPAGEATAGPGQAEASHSGNLTAQATSAASVLLAWEPVAGASQYGLEVRFGDGDFLPAADLAPGETSFEHFVLPGASDLSYRLTATMSSGASEVGAASIILPPLQPDPLVVKPETFKPTLVGMPGFDPETFDPNTMLPPGFDPNNPEAFDPSAMFPPGFDPNDPESFDPSSMMQIVSATQEIGPEGGSVSVTAPDAVAYALEVPAGAVDQPIVFTLTPVETITGLPLSGGMLGAVRIQPEGFPFNLPALLTITPAAAAANPSAPLTLGFAVSPISQEFFLYPLDSSPGLASNRAGSGRMARFVPRPAAQASSSGMAIRNGATYGVGTGTSQDVRDQSQRVPTDAADQMAQHDAQRQAAPQPSAAALAQTADAILLSMVGSSSAGDLARTTASLEQYWQDGGGDKDPARSAKLLDLYTSRIKMLFDRAKGDCLTSEDVVAADTADKLIDGVSDFWKRVRETYRSKYGESGQKLLDDLYQGKASCSYTLEITSTIRFESKDGWEEAEVHTATPIELRPSRGGDPMVANSMRLTGIGSVAYVRYEFKGKKCPVTKVTQYPKVNLDITGLYPEFGDDNRIFDFWFRYFELGSNFTRNVSVSGKEDKKGCMVSLNLMGGGDVWSGGFVLLRSEHSLRNWEFTSRTYPLVFTNQVRNLSYAVPGNAGTVTENATYTITIQRASKP